MANIWHSGRRTAGGDGGERWGGGSGARNQPVYHPGTTGKVIATVLMNPALREHAAAGGSFCMYQENAQRSRCTSAWFVTAIRSPLADLACN